MANAIITRTYQDHAIGYNSEGWFNATQAASKFGKEPTSWIRQSDTAEYISALADAKSNSGFLTEFNKIKDLDGQSSKARTMLLALVKKTGLVKTKAGAPENGGGTWLHPKLAVPFARWLDVHFAVWCDAQIDGILRGTDDKKKARHISAVSYKSMSAMLHDVRLIENKDTQSHHYANEAKLVNWAYCGEFKSLDRDIMSFTELDLIAFLEIRNMILIGRGVTYDQRKPMLKQYAMDWRMAHTPLIG